MICIVRAGLSHRRMCLPMVTGRVQVKNVKSLMSALCYWMQKGGQHCTKSWRVQFINMVNSILNTIYFYLYLVFVINIYLLVFVLKILFYASFIWVFWTVRIGRMEFQIMRFINLEIQLLRTSDRLWLIAFFEHL